MLRDDEVARVYLNECGGYSGFVGADDTDVLARESVRDHDRATTDDEAERFSEELAAECAPELQQKLDRLGVIYMAGIATQYRRTRGMSPEKWRAAADDVRIFFSLARRWRLKADLWRAYDAAIELVDANFGCIESARRPLAERGRLTAKELRELFDGAPRTGNPDREPVWHAGSLATD